MRRTRRCRSIQAGVLGVICALSLSLHAASFTTVAPGLTTARANHSVTLLQNGKVLIAGGNGGSAGILDSAELFDIATGTSVVLTMKAARYYHTATLLRNGKVLIAGGYSSSAPIASAELFDPANNSFTLTTGALHEARFAHSATLLNDGRVLIAGGNNGSPTDTLEIYDPSTNSFTLLATKLSAKRAHNATCLLPSGKVLISGGADSFASNTADVFDATAGTLNTYTMNAYRMSHTATLLPNGKVLLAGGSTTATPQDSAELFDPSTNAFTPVSGTMTVPRDRHRAALLPNGIVLITGGGTTGNTPLSAAEYYDPTAGPTGTFVSLGSMNEARHSHGMVLLPGGDALIAGGEASSTTTRVQTIEVFATVAASVTPFAPLPAPRAAHTSTLMADGKVLITGGRMATASGYVSASAGAIFDPATSTYTPTTSMNAGRAYHAATLLPSGRILLTGGVDNGGTAQASADVYDPVSGYFLPTGPMNAPHAYHKATLLASGKVLITGGTGADSAEIYDPVLGTFKRTNGPMLYARNAHTATLLRSALVLVGGGTTQWLNMELFDPSTSTFRLTGNFVPNRAFSTATLMPDGSVYISGGETSPASTLDALLYDPVSESSTFFPQACQRSRHAAISLPGGSVALIGGACSAVELWDRLGTRRTFFNSAPAVIDRGAMRLTDGRVLLTGGFALNQPVAQVDILDTNLNAAARKPLLNAVSTICQPSSSFTLTGSGFAGDSEGSTGGWQSSAANAPQLRIQAVDSERIDYIRPTSWTPTSLVVPPINTLPVGWSRVSVVSNGIPSVERVVLLGKTSAAPALGSYATSAVPHGSSVTVTPSSAPLSLDASTVMRATASANFSGSISIDPATGAVTIQYAHPIGAHTITVTLTTACSGSLTRTFTLNVNPVAAPVITATAIASDRVRVSWPAVPGADHYGIYHRGAPGSMTFVASTGLTSYDFTGYAANSAHLYQVETVDSFDSKSALSNRELATTAMFIDDPLTAGTVVKLAHVTQLRTAANAVRSLAGLGAYSFTAITGVVRASHLLELRTAIDQARSTIGLPAATYPTSVATGQPIRASGITEIRNAVK